MKKFQKEYILVRMNEKTKEFLSRLRMAKQEGEIEPKVCKRIKFKPFKNKKNRLKNLLCQMAYPELRNQEYKEPEVDIYDEERNEKIIKKFFEAGEIIIEEQINEKKQKNNNEKDK